jgi:Anti-sigma-K factor rskA, C-terminal
VSEELTAEDRALLAALAALERAPGTAAAPASLPGSSPPAGTPGPAGQATVPEPAELPAETAEAETLGRLYRETLGLVPYALPPVAPPPEARLRLMALVGLAPLAPAAPLAPVGWAAAASPATVAAPAIAAPAAPLSPTAAPAVASRHSPLSRPPRWPLALAAALILALLGTCGWLYHGLAEQAGAVARLGAERDAALRHSGEMAARLAQLNTQVSNLRDSVAMVTSPAVEVCTLRAVTAAGTGASSAAAAGITGAELAAASGMLFVAADHQHWYLSVRGLRPPASGRVYQLWFVADQGTVSGGTFAAASGAATELSSERMPAGTRGVRITLEQSPGAPAPSGPDVLRNADALHSI